jgi:peptidoglycan/LPS O-acetylase OafA/YrhL
LDRAFASEVARQTASGSGALLGNVQSVLSTAVGRNFVCFQRGVSLKIDWFRLGGTILGTFRFLLALSVALSHFGTAWGYHIMNGRMAVQCFYIISGFLISLVLSHKYDPTTAEGRWLFYSNRALRIFVPYWSLCVMILGVHLMMYFALGVRFGVDAAFMQYWPEMTLPTRIYLLFSNIFILTQEWSMWLVYHSGAIIPVWNSDLHDPHLGMFQVIPQAWSVSLELMFYALAPFLVRRPWLVLVAIIVATYVLRSVALAYGLNGSGFAYRFFPFEIGLFLAGVLSHRVYAHLNSRGVMRLPISVAIATTLIGVVLLQQYVDNLDNHKFYILVVAALPALFDVSRRIKLDGWLGELSYPIYLAHLSVLSFGQIVTMAVLGPIENRNWLAFVMVVVTVLVSIAYVYWVDAPFERWRQGRATGIKQERTPSSLSQPHPVALTA